MIFVRLALLGQICHFNPLSSPLISCLIHEEVLQFHIEKSSSEGSFAHTLTSKIPYVDAAQSEARLE